MMWPNSCRIVGPWYADDTQPGGLRSDALITTHPLTNCGVPSGGASGRETAANWSSPSWNGMSVCDCVAHAITTGAHRWPYSDGRYAERSFWGISCVDP